MSPMFNNLNIGLKGYELLQVKDHNGLSVHVELKAALEPGRCPHCFSGRIRSKGRYLRKARHLECFKQGTTLYIHTRRFQCRCCSRSFIPVLPGVLKGRHSSEAFREQVFEQHHHGVCTSTIAAAKGLGQATVSRIYAQFTRRKASERISLDCPQYLGIDEHTLHKGQRFSTTLCDLRNHRVFDVRPGRSITDLAPYLARLRGREKVKVVCIDLSSPYRNIIRRYFPNARIVADRFHVVRLIYHHFMTLARAVAPGLKSHRGALAAKRKRPSRLSARQRERLGGLFERYPALQPLYTQMHQLRRLMNRKNQTRKQCRVHARMLHKHIHRLRYSDLKPLTTLASSLLEWEKPIACMWRFVKNNGITEGFHRKMKLIQRRAYGFRNFENYRLRVIAQCG
ncbi:ISL3 family transposase ISLpn11 [Rubritalea halochordaticola]|uniref:ISL3 family transposase ISLpn11 n=1 Tax=Rubritalea halochordaticola TaxID=714537 RepID=A0ABP9UWY2_9BACT